MDNNFLVNEQEFIDNNTAADMLGIKTNYLRQLVYRKKLMPVGRQKRKSMFLLADVLALQTQRNKTMFGEDIAES